MSGALRLGWIEFQSNLAQCILSIEFFGLFCPADCAIFRLDFDPPFPAARLHQFRGAIAIASAVGTRNSAAIELLNPVSVEPGTEIAFPVIHVTEDCVTRLQAVVRHGRSYLKFRWLKCDVNASHSGDCLSFSDCGHWLTVSCPGGIKLDFIIGGPRAELAALKRAGILVDFWQRGLRSFLGSELGIQLRRG